MSKIAKTPIIIPLNVEVKIKSQKISICNKHHKLTYVIHKDVCVQYNNEKLNFYPYKDTTISWAITGTIRALINNMIIGISNGFTKTLNIIGIGYRVSVTNNIVNLWLGFSHTIEYKLPKGILANCPNPNEIIIKGINKQLVGQVAADLRNFRKPDPYKGKGICYSDEIIKLKESRKK